MWPNPEFPADLLTFTEESQNGKLHFFPGKGKECRDESFIISPSLFEITKLFIFVEIFYFELNEI